jgi:hypothetical protein
MKLEDKPSCPVASEIICCDVCVIGGGSAGFGAALAAVRAGARVALVEREATLGGTSTAAWVASWEPGPGCSFAEEIYRRLKPVPGAAALIRRIHRYRPDEPYGIVFPPEGERLPYEASLRRAGVPAEARCSVLFRPEVLAETLAAMLREAGVTPQCEARLNAVEAGDGRVRSIQALRASGQCLEVRAEVFVDATGGAQLCRQVGCEMMLGVEAAERFGEPSAPAAPADFLNAISLCYRIRPGDGEGRPQAPSEPTEPFGHSAHVVGFDWEELIVNPLALVPGWTLVEEGEEATLALARRRVAAHWDWLRTYPHFRGYELVGIAPRLGVREGHRVVTEYVLTERDLRAGASCQTHADIVAWADHAMDIHGGDGLRELEAAYGIPYRCLIPRGWSNLMVACRGAGFSHLAASSARLSRTMMALGHAAGIAAAQAARNGLDVRRVTAPCPVTTA